MRLVYNLVLGLAVAVSLAISPLFVSDARAIGLGVDPGEINLSNVPLGKKVAVSKLGGEAMLLRIENKSAPAFTYTIEILPTSKPDDLKAGYTDIPDTSWLWPEKKEVRIAGGSTEAVELYLKLPKKKKYYNKRYQAIIEVKSKKERPQDLFVLACQVRFCFSTERLEKKIERKAQLDKYPRRLTVIKTPDRWGADLSFLSALKRQFPGIKIRELDYSTKKGKSLAEKLNIDFLPAYIFHKDIEKSKRFSSLTEAKLIRPVGRNYYLHSAANQSGIFIKAERTPHTLEVFSMGQCPFSAAALEKIITAKKDGRLPRDFKLDCHYIARLVAPCKPCGEPADMLKFSSLHGQAEVEEDIRQLCIKKYEPEKFLDYLLLRNKDIGSADWEAPAGEAGIGIEVIKKCALNKEGKTLLKEDIKRAEELNITASPAFLYENKILIMDFNLLKELPGLESLETITAEPEVDNSPEANAPTPQATTACPAAKMLMLAFKSVFSVCPHWIH